MSFRLNDKHKEIPKGARRRGKRTVAKEKLYKTILAEIRNIGPGFNIGVSARIETLSDKWRLPYMRWSFVPSDETFDSTLTKPRHRK